VWGTAITVECYARGTTQAPADEALDALFTRVYARLHGDPTLGGAVGGLSAETLSLDYDVDGEQTACAMLSFVVRHASRAALVQPA
jgi:hypothetical protein